MRQFEFHSLVVLGLFACAACATDEEPSPQDYVGSSAGTSAGTRTYSGTAGAQAAGSPAVPIGGAASMGGANAAGAAGAATAGVPAAGGQNTAGSGAGQAGAGTGGTTPVMTAPSVCDGNATRKLTTSKADSLVDDFQGSMLSVKWSRFSDVMPVPNSFDLLQKTDDGAATTGKSGRYQGTGAKTLASGGYGVGIVFNIAVIKAQGLSCADISDFDGVSFWAKSSMEDASFEVNFVVPATNAVADGGDCTGGCYNHPRTSVQLSKEWQQHTVKFAEVFNGSAPIRDRVQMLAFTIADAEDWDFSLDEIAWFKGTPPTGPVAP